MIGRPLDLTSEAEDVSGDTWAVFVSRQNLYDDGMEALLEDNVPFNLPLEVTFYGERAQDLGGPRKEFLTALCRMIREKLFAFDPELHGYVLQRLAYYRTRRHYYGAGVALC